VAAVFAQGPEWQFKGWRWGRDERDPKTGAFLRPDITPTEIFDRALGFHLMYDGDAVHENVGKWAVTPLRISKSRRYTDPGVAQQFWAALDGFIWHKKPYLLPKGVTNVGAGAAGAPAGAGHPGT
jgi:parafibromin